RTLNAGWRLHCRGFRYDELIQPHADEEVLDLPGAKRPEDLVRYENRAGRGFGKAIRVERHEPQVPFRVAHREARGEPCLFGPDDRPGAWRRPRAGERTARRFLQRYRSSED